VKCQKQAFSFNKREAKVYFYAFLHVLKRDTCINHEENFFFLVRNAQPFQYVRPGLPIALIDLKPSANERELNFR
jgi:hypothetical protein